MTRPARTPAETIEALLRRRRRRTCLMQTVTVEQVEAGALSEVERGEVVRLCTEAYGEDFSGFFQTMPGTTHLLARRDGRLVSHLAWVTRWLQPEGLPCLETAYIEAVATLPTHQGRGYASLLLREAPGRLLRYELAALSPSDAAFYRRLGWESWQGRLGIRTPETVLATPEDEEVMILRLPKTPALDLNARLTAEWRTGELW